MKLYLKIMLFVLALILAAVWANIHFSRAAVSEAMSAQIAETGEVAASALVPDFRRALGAGSESEALKALQAFSLRTGALYAALLAPNGMAVAHTNVALAGADMSGPLLYSSVRDRSTVFRRDYYRTENLTVEIVEALIPVPAEQRRSGEALILEGAQEEGEPAGYLMVGLSLASARRAEAEIELKLLILAFIIAAAALAVSALFARLLLRQVELLETGIEKVRAGEYEFSVPVVSRDELGAVASSFNELSRGLAETTVSKQYLDSLIESMPDPFIITDEKGMVMRANRAAAVFAGRDFSPPGSVNLRALLEPEAAGAPHPYEALAKGAHIRELDLLMVAGNGKRRPAMLSAAVAGRQVVVVLKDTAQHKESESRIAQYLKDVERANSELDSFAHTVSHDLKEPLRGIEMFSGMLIADYAAKLDPQAADYLGRVVKAASRMRRLIDDLLGYARIARVRNPYETASSAALAEEAAAGLSALIAERKGSVKLDPGLPDIFCDPVKMRQVFHNLISNALKYNDSPAPEARVSAEMFGLYWKFTVADNGIGVPPQYAVEIFRMFKRLHSRHEYGGGTGAGLAIVHKIIEEHGGRVWVDSEEGRGSSFRFIIPAGEGEKA